MLWAFALVLSWSRALFPRFCLRAAMPSFVRGHVDAFAFFQGVPHVLLYDNLKSAVLERVGSAIRFHPTLLELAAHYRFEPRPVAVARGNEKGGVERAIRYVRQLLRGAHVEGPRRPQRPSARVGHERRPGAPLAGRQVAHSA